MKAVLALTLLYVGTFLVVIQGASQNQIQAAPQNAAAAQDNSQQGQAKSIDPVKESDIRALMELVGVRDQVQDGVSASAEQYREKLLATVPNNEKGQAFVDAFVASYEKKFDPDQITDQVVGIYDKHYTDEEIKGLLQFFGSPLGQKVAAEIPRSPGKSPPQAARWAPKHHMKRCKRLKRRIRRSASPPAWAMASAAGRSVVRDRINLRARRKTSHN